VGFRSTREVARLLGIGASRLSRAVWDRRLPAPEKGPGGAYFWSDEDLERASRHFRRRDASDLLAAEGGER
jgi:hypothetical protein